MAAAHDEALAGRTAQGFRDKSTTDPAILADSDAARIAAAERDKAWNTLRARAALIGVELYIVAGAASPLPEFIAAMGAWSKTFDALANVETWLDRIEGRP